MSYNKYEMASNRAFIYILYLVIKYFREQNNVIHVKKKKNSLATNVQSFGSNLYCGELFRLFNKVCSSNDTITLNGIHIVCNGCLRSFLVCYRYVTWVYKGIYARKYISYILKKYND